MPYDFTKDSARTVLASIKEAAGEYEKWALEARKKYVELRLRQDPAIRRLYIRAADSIAKDLRKLQARTYSDTLRRQHLEELEASLRREAARFTDELSGQLQEAIQEAVNAGTGFSRAVALDLGKQAGWDGGRLREIFAQVNRQAVEAMWARTRDGLYLSDRIWRAGENLRATMRDIVQEAVATGQDAVKTARMLEKYVRTDARTLAKDYPNMMKRMAGRIPGNITYEALRLARTEATAAFGEGTIAAARVSPSYVGMKWVLSKAHPLPDICDTLADADFGLGRGVYPPGNEPLYPAHPNELCHLIPVHQQPEDFVKRLKRWKENPELEPELEKWYNDIYKGGDTKATFVVSSPPPAPVRPDVPRTYDELVARFEEEIKGWAGSKWQGKQWTVGRPSGALGVARWDGTIEIHENVVETLRRFLQEGAKYDRTTLEDVKRKLEVLLHESIHMISPKRDAYYYSLVMGRNLEEGLTEALARQKIDEFIRLLRLDTINQELLSIDMESIAWAYQTRVDTVRAIARAVGKANKRKPEEFIEYLANEVPADNSRMTAIFEAVIEDYGLKNLPAWAENRLYLIIEKALNKAHQKTAAKTFTTEFNKFIKEWGLKGGSE